MSQAVQDGKDSWRGCCIFCDNNLTADTRREHVLLNALGGRKTTITADCSHCNETFGSSIDRTMADEVKNLRNLFQMKSGDGALPPALNNILSSQGPINFKPDGAPHQKRRPFVVTKKGSYVEVIFNVSSFEELLRYVPHAAAQVGISEDVLWDRLESERGTLETRYPGEIQFTLECKQIDSQRSMVKSCMVLLATTTSNDQLKGPAFAAVRDFIFRKNETIGRGRINKDGRLMPKISYDYLKDNYGPLFNLIYVKSDSKGRTIAYFRLYNIYTWQFVLSEADGPKNAEIALASNPLDNEVWNADVAREISLSFDWLDSPNNTGSSETCKRQLEMAFKFYADRARSQICKNIVRETLEKHYSDGDRIEMDKRGEVAVNEISTKIMLSMLQIPRNEEIFISRPFSDSHEPG
ncbi:HNH endonuclease [Novacetimonas pomaceti]|uniref:HNH endonuclease n=1 Tax=Novacetimonas pomaceti TaxID=2021998 RepID=UPI001C2DCD7E|nr:HNH endonuclease [Novacetimonas pomaceti]MBV1834118.1 HNH endonuclease [Novacetimonas pomaceti]